MKSAKLTHSLINELEKAGLLRSDKADLIKKHLKDLEHALSIKNLKKVEKAIDQISGDLID